MSRLSSSLAIASLARMIYVGALCQAQQPAQQSEQQTKQGAQYGGAVAWEQSPDLAPSGWILGSVRLPRLVQRVNATGTLVAQGSSNGLDLMDLSTSASIILPDLLFESGSLFTINPSFSVTTVEGPAGVDLPSELYRTGVMLGWMKRPNERTSYSLGISPSVASDFETSDNAFRLTAHAMMTYQWSPGVQFMLGAAYLNRNDISVLPMAGLVWTPREDLRLEFTAPRPRIAQRIAARNSCGAVVEDWLYLAGEFGGGTWGVVRTPGATDELTFRDFRLVLGYENKSSGKMSTRAEIGYVFGRKVEYESDGFEFQPGDAMMMRAGIRF